MELDPPRPRGGGDRPAHHDGPELCSRATDGSAGSPRPRHASSPWSSIGRTRVSSCSPSRSWSSWSSLGCRGGRDPLRRRRRRRASCELVAVDRAGRDHDLRRRSTRVRARRPGGVPRAARTGGSPVPRQPGHPTSSCISSTAIPGGRRRAGTRASTPRRSRRPSPIGGSSSTTTARSELPAHEARPADDVRGSAHRATSRRSRAPFGPDQAVDARRLRTVLEQPRAVWPRSGLPDTTSSGCPRAGATSTSGMSIDGSRLLARRSSRSPILRSDGPREHPASVSTRHGFSRGHARADRTTPTRPRVTLASEPHDRPRFVFVHVPDAAPADRLPRRRLGRGRQSGRRVGHVPRLGRGDARSSAASGLRAGGGDRRPDPRRGRRASCWRRRAAGRRPVLRPWHRRVASTRTTPCIPISTNGRARFLAALTPGDDRLFDDTDHTDQHHRRDHQRVHGHRRARTAGSDVQRTTARSSTSSRS